MKKKYNIIKISLGFLLVTILSFLCISIFSLKSQDVKADDNVVKPNLYVSVSMENGYAVPSTSGNVTFTFRLDKAPEKDVIVTFRAEDVTAISEAGDYYYVSDDYSKLTKEEKVKKTHASNSLIINASNYNGVALTYEVGTTTYGCIGPSGEYLYNYFNVVIDSVENAEYTGNRNYKCRMSVKATLSMSKYSDGTNHAGYYYYYYFTKQCTNSFYLDTHYGEDDFNHKTCCNDFGSSVYSIYNNTVGLGWGQLNMCYWMYKMEAKTYNISNVTFHIYFGGAAHRLCSDNIGHINQEENYDDNDAERMDIDYSDWTPVKDGNKMDGIEYYKETEPWKDGKVHTKTYFKVPTDWGCNYYVYAKNQTSATWRRGYGTSKERLSDDVNPVLLNTYVNTDTLMTEGKLRLILRFSELVDGHETSITTFLGGYKPLVFRYSSGAGTNTLVYEADLRTDEFMNKSETFSYIKLDTFDGLIYDLGYNWEKKDTNSIKIKYGGLDIPVSIDLRNPQLSDATTERQTESTKTRTVSISASSITTGMLYYCWSKEATGVFETIDDFTDAISDANLSRYAGSRQISKSAVESATYTITSPSGLNGDYYLHVLVVSEFGKFDKEVYGVMSTGSLTSGYHLDNTDPFISVERLEESTQFEKKYSFTVEDTFKNDTAAPAGINTIGVMIYEASSSENITNMILYNETVNLYEENRDVVKATSGTGTFIFDLDKILSDKSNINDLKIRIKDKELAAIPSDGYGTYYYYFYCTDKAGNTTVTDPIEYKFENFDVREQFACGFTSNMNNLYEEINEKPSAGIQENVFNINASNDTKLLLSFTNNEADDDTIKSDVLTISKIYYGSKTNVVYDYSTSSSYDEYITVSVITNAKKKNLDITPKKVGFYKFEFVLNRTLNDNSTLTLYSNEKFEFYVTDRTWDSTSGYNYENTTNYLNSLKDLTVINKVFQLNNSYIYMGANEKITAVNYNDCASPASFSSETKALEYIKFMEYQDLDLCVLGAQDALLLQNGGSSKFQKADGQDAIEAKTGQTWIRYKRLSWNEISSLEGWAYYYYSNKAEDSININLLSANSPLLANAINSIADYLLKKGSWVYLTEEDYFDKFNCPTLKAAQIHNQLESVTKSNAGDEYANQLSFEGDTGMYLNTTTIGDSNYTVANGLILSLKGVNKLYYLNEATNELIPIENADGMSLGKALSGKVGSGKVKIIELDGNGTREFEVVVDTDAPVVNVSWQVTGNDASSQASSIDMNANNDGQSFSAKAMTISLSKSTSEIDSLAYVAVYTKPQYQFVSITYYKDLASNPIRLEDGNYYIVVGDRYGNTYKIIAQVCNSKFEAKVEVIDNQYVLVTTNRTADQIERFEVRCNNILQTDEYNEKGNKYMLDGYYNIYIKDIYGYTNSSLGEFGENCLFERELPKLTWYYQNSNFGFTKYDETASSCMRITSSPETSTYYINTAKILKFTFDGEYAFSFSGISESCVTKNENSHYVVIDTTDNWTMKVWYVAYPNVIATYVCTNDTQAPNITCSYKVNNFVLESQNEMDEFSSNNPLHEIYRLSNVKFTQLGTSSKNISENEWITANLITVKANDLSGINSVVVYLNDEIYKEYKDIEGEFSGCTLSRSGVYKIVAKDNFGNEKVLNFTNNPQSLVNTSVDSTVVAEANNKVLYGNSKFSFTLKDNATIYLNIEGCCLICTLRDGKLIYTKYVNTDIGGDLKSLVLETKTKLVLNEEDEYITVDDAFFDTTSKDFRSETQYEFMGNENAISEAITFKELTGVKFYCSYSTDGSITFEFEPEGNKKLEIEASIIVGEQSEPYHFEAKLSKETTDINLETIDSVLINCENDKVVRTNVDFIITNNDILKDIKEISYSYSNVKEFVDYKTIYVNQAFTSNLDTTVNGFYSFLITNKYGNTINYIVNRSDVYSVLGYAIYDDYVESRFDSDYGTEYIKANNKIRFEAYTDLDDRNTFVLTKEGSTEPIPFTPTYDNGYYTYTFNTEGKYQLTATDSYGNVVVKNFEIYKSNISYNDSYITGFNDKALLLDKGYTNKLLSIDLTSVKNNDIQYISTITQSEKVVKGYKVITKVERILYNTLTQDSVGLNSKYAWIITYEYTYNTNDEPTLTSKTKQIIDLTTGEILEDNQENKELVKNNDEYTNKYVEIIGNEGSNDYQVIFRDSYGSIAKKDVHYKESSTLTITRHTRNSSKEEVIDINDAIQNGVWSNSSVIFTSTSGKFTCSSTYNGEKSQVNKMPLTFAFTAENGTGKFEYSVEYLDEYGNSYTIAVHLVRQELAIALKDGIETVTIDNIETTRNNIQLSFTSGAKCVYRIDSGNEIVYNENDVLFKDGTYRFEVTDQAGNIVTKVIRKDTICEFEFKVGTTGKVLINGDVVNSGTVKFESSNGDSAYIKAAYRDNVLVSEGVGSFSKDGLWTILIEDAIGNIQLFEFNIITHKRSHFEYTTPFTYKITEFWYDAGDGVLIDIMEQVNHTDSNSSFEIKENGTYTVVMISSIMKNTIDYVFTIDTSIPTTALVGCEVGERTNNDITFENISKGDTIEIYRNGELYSSVEITEKGDIPTISDGGEYTVVITNEAGVSTTLNFVRNNIANAAGSALIIVILTLSIVGIIIGSIIHNRQKVDE